MPFLYNTQSNDVGDESLQHAAHVLAPPVMQTSAALPQVVALPMFTVVFVLSFVRSRSLLYGSRPGQPSVSDEFSYGVSATPSPDPLQPP